MTVFLINCQINVYQETSSKLKPPSIHRVIWLSLELHRFSTLSCVICRRRNFSAGHCQALAKLNLSHKSIPLVSLSLCERAKHKSRECLFFFCLKIWRSIYNLVASDIVCFRSVFAWPSSVVWFSRFPFWLCALCKGSLSIRVVVITVSKGLR